MRYLLLLLVTASFALGSCATTRPPPNDEVTIRMTEPWPPPAQACEGKECPASAPSRPQRSVPGD